MAWYNPTSWGKSNRYGRKPAGLKQSRTTSAVVAQDVGRAKFTPVDYLQLAKEGHNKNVTAFSSIRKVSTSVAAVPWTLFTLGKGGELTEVSERHPLIELLKRPNPRMGRGAFFENLTAFLLLSGNSYIEKIGPDREGAPPKELWPLRPDRMKVVVGNREMPIGGYQHTVNGRVTKIEAEDVLHMKTFNPTDDFYGLSPIQVAARSIDEANEAKAWNVALLQNSGKPSGAFIAKDTLGDDQLDELKSEIDDKVSSARNAGRPLVLDGDLRWEEMGLTPKDMDWIKGQKLSAREIANAFGVPPELVGDSESKTYASYQEARKSFYEETVIPLLEWIRGELNNWLVPLFGDNLFLDFNRDAIPALQEDRDAVFKRANDSNFLSVNEKRVMVGFDEVPGGDVILIPLNLVPLGAGFVDDVPEDEPPDDEDKGVKPKKTNGIVKGNGRIKRLRFKYCA